MDSRFLGATLALSLLMISTTAAANTMTGPLTLTTGCCTAPRDPSTVFDPNNSPVTLTGWVDVSGLSVGSAVFIGLIDKQQYDLAGSTFMSGAYTYISRADATTLWVGPSDGNLGGEIVQEFDLVNGETLVNFTTVIGGGQISVDWSAGSQSGGPVLDTYGDVKTLNNASGYAWDEFEFGAILGVDVFANSTPGTVDFSVTAVPEPSSAVLLGLCLLGAVTRRRASAQRQR
ncbi:MAG: PEP-CTERM sorting domain-containing protein [Myxococcota bacterium]